MAQVLPDAAMSLSTSANCLARGVSVQLTLPVSGMAMQGLATTGLSRRGGEEICRM